MTDKTSNPIESLSMVGPSYARKLRKLGINTVEDLLHYYPIRYEDLTLLSNDSPLIVGEKVTLQGTVSQVTNIHTKSGKTLQKTILHTQEGINLPISWFNQPYLTNTLRPQTNLIVSGKLTEYQGRISLQSPQYEIIKSSKPNETIHTNRLVPIYPLTAGLSSKYLRTRLAPLLKSLTNKLEWLPQSILTQLQLIDYHLALQQIHFPTNQKLFDAARYRLQFDELFLLQLYAQLQKSHRSQQHTAHNLTLTQSQHQRFIDSLPFKLTLSQIQSCEEIRQDLAQGKPMNRLLEGEVGSGKTVVAAYAAFISLIHKLPVVLMAPTEILCQQHARSLDQFLAPFGFVTSLQTRSSRIDAQKAQLVVGTQALLHRDLPSSIGVVIIDEQHRFGVNQRAMLAQKQALPPHILSMTATPIPRTIALTLYADLDVSIIEDMPHGRKPVKTWVVPESKRKSAYIWLQEQIESNQVQAFIVCPLITESETPSLDEVKAAVSEYENLSKNIFPSLRVELIHGGLKSKEKQSVLDRFAKHEADILVATPVIEVGIDIPNANIILIEAAERFGLAALHQLRGRVGRSSTQGYCFLFSSQKQIPKRLKHLESNHSGLALAQIDLETRGAGNLYGTQQSGHIDLKIATLTDQALIHTTYEQAKQLIKLDPLLKKHPLLKTKLKTHLEKAIVPN